MGAFSKGEVNCGDKNLLFCDDADGVADDAAGCADAGTVVAEVSAALVGGAGPSLSVSSVDMLPSKRT